MTELSSTDPLLRLLDEFSRSGVKVLHLRSGGFDLLLSNDPAVRGSVGAPVAIAPAAVPAVAAAPAHAPAAASVAAPAATAATPLAALPADAVIVTAPNLGTFYRAPKPGAAPYVEVGATFAVGDELCLIEVMKLFTSVRAEQPGRLLAILAEDGAMVEAGQPLFAMAAL
jgi:acetyl-CoA carboxylase biotin carboxyl carrier protein